MFRRTITLFKLFGFSVRIDLSWLIILGLVVWSLAGAVFPEQYKGLGLGTYIVMAVVAAFGLFASIVAHEMCHSLVARLYGMQMRGITLFMFGGVAEMQDEPPSARAEFFMALAGPAASVVIAGVFLGLSYLGEAASWPVTVNAVLRWIGFINALLVAFNLIPGFPLDGGRVLRAALWHWQGDLRRATHTASRVGSGFGIVLIALGVLNLVTLNPIGGLWWILIGMFIRGAARSSYQQVLFREALKGEPVQRFMNARPVTVPASTSVASLVSDYIYTHHYKMFPVMDDGRLVGCVTTQQIKDVPQEQWPRRTVGELAAECSEQNTISPEEDAVHAFAQMNRHEASRLMVVRDGKLEGILSLKDLLKFLSLKLELEGADGKVPPSLRKAKDIASGGQGPPPLPEQAPEQGQPQHQTEPGSRQDSERKEHTVGSGHNQS